jgi:FixJ family two-component response regulator
MTQPIVYIIDDDKAVRSAIQDLLESIGMQSKAYASGREFREAYPADPPAGCLILDVRFPGSSGLDFQRELAAANFEIPIVFITGHGDIPMSVQAMKAGAVDFLPKPFREQELWMLSTKP